MNSGVGAVLTTVADLTETRLRRGKTPEVDHKSLAFPERDTMDGWAENRGYRVPRQARGPPNTALLQMFAKGGVKVGKGGGGQTAGKERRKGPRHRRPGNDRPARRRD